MPTSSSPTGVDPAAVAAVLAGVDPAPLRMVLFGSRARGDARPDSDLDLLVLNAQEPPRSHSLQRLIQDLEGCGDTITLAPELLELDDFAVLARYDADPTPLPGERGRLLALLEALHEELRGRVG